MIELYSGPGNQWLSSMNEKTKTKPELAFVEAPKRGLADCDEVDDYIDEWHDGPYTCELYEFLGMTRRQYFAWGEDESYLRRTFPRGGNTE